ncbi:MAG: peroxiredoxin family protein [Lentisphaeria bacterium]
MRALTLLLLLTLAITACRASEQRIRGIRGQQAPKWEAGQWINLPEGKKSIDINDYEGKVVYLFCFQSWCPGCHSSGFPTLQTLSERYSDDEGVAFVAIQTVFEGFSSNTAKRAWENAKKYKLDFPVGHSGSRGEYSKVMRAYRTGGTPWTIIIDRDGVVRYNDFHVKPKAAITLINKLKAAEAEED